MKFGLPLLGVGPKRSPMVSRLAEENGFESVWLAEHLVLPSTIPPAYLYSGTGMPPINPRTPLYDPWVVLGGIASQTTTIRLGTNVFILPLRHPITTARSTVTLDRLSGGRVTLGIGVGWLKDEFDAVGLDFSTRGKRADEAIAVLRRLWAEDEIEHAGDHYTFGPVRFEPKPLQPRGIPIEVGGTSQAALRRAARLGDGWLAIGAFEAGELEAKIAFVHEERKRAGRDGEPFEISCACSLDPDEVRRLADAGVTRVISSPPWRGSVPERGAVEDWIREWGERIVQAGVGVTE